MPITIITISITAKRMETAMRVEAVMRLLMIDRRNDTRQSPGIASSSDTKSL